MMCKECYFSGDSMTDEVAIKMHGVDFSDDYSLEFQHILYSFFSSTAQIRRNGPNQKYFLYITLEME